MFVIYLTSYYKKGQMPIRHGRNAPVTLILRYESTSKINTYRVSKSFSNGDS